MAVEFKRMLKFKMDQSELRMKQPCERPLYKPLKKVEEANFNANFAFFASLSTAEAHVFGVKFIGLYETVTFIVICGVMSGQ